ncbi:MAG: DUF4920 domain-containing protein [Bacteroidota bacterium]
MKYIIFIFVLSLTLFSCKDGKEQTEEAVAATEETIEEKAQYQTFGAEIDDQNVVGHDVMMAKYNKMKPGDTTNIKFIANVKKVCQNKGCWMRLDLGDDAESFVKFKDYGFFMPKDIAGQEVIVQGKAFVEETSVEDLKHFAKDGGKTQEEIDAITEPELSYSFISEGVLLVEK